MRIQKLVVASFLALVIGASFGLLKDEVLPNAEANAYEGLRPEHFVDESADRPTKADQEFKAREIECLWEIAFREGQDQSVHVRRGIAMATIARRDDTDPQWPRTICGIMRQKGQISGINNELTLNIRQLRVLIETQDLAADIYENMWRTTLLPHGWECVRYWKVSDQKLATLGPVQLAQLGISKAMTGLGFFSKLRPVRSPPGDVTFYRDPNRCHKPLPTT